MTHRGWGRGGARKKCFQSIVDVPVLPCDLNFKMCAFRTTSRRHLRGAEESSKISLPYFFIFLFLETVLLLRSGSRTSRGIISRFRLHSLTSVGVIDIVSLHFRCEHTALQVSTEVGFTWTGRLLIQCDPKIPFASVHWLTLPS